MRDAETDPTWKHRIYVAVGLGLRLYVASLGIAGLYSLLWLFEIAGYLDSGSLGIIWLSIAGMVVVFLILLMPVFRTTR